MGRWGSCPGEVRPCRQGICHENRGCRRLAYVRNGAGINPIGREPVLSQRQAPRIQVVADAPVAEDVNYAIPAQVLSPTAWIRCGRLVSC